MKETVTDSEEIEAPAIEEEPIPNATDVINEDHTDPAIEAETDSSQLGEVKDEHYINNQLGFTFPVPEYWEEFLSIKEGSWSKDQAVEHSIDFFYTSDKVEQYVFSILVLSEEMNPEDRSPWTYLTASHGNTYAYATPGDPNLELLKPENSDHLAFVQKMISEDLPIMMEQFELTK